MAGKPKAVMKILLKDPDTKKLMNARTQNSVRNLMHKAKAEEKVAKVGAGFRNTLGGLNTFVEENTKAALLRKHGEKFSEHDVYVLDQYVVEENAERGCLVRVCISSDNLLLNAYRQAMSGLPALLCLDTTHRLVVQGYPVFPIGTTDIAQRFHIIAYMVATNERAEDYGAALTAVKAAVEAVVAEYAHNKWRV